MLQGGMGGILKQAKKMQEQMEKAQQELALIEITGESGGGMAKVIMTCSKEVRKIQLDPTLLDTDRDMLEDLLVAAMNDAIRKAEQTSQEKMGALAQIPGLGNLGGMLGM